MLDILRDAAAYLVAIALLVAFHEFGHFWAARRFGVKVLRFSIGFGKPLWQRTGRDGVEYVLAAIPLGGYVKLLDEREAPVAEAEQHRAFNRQPVAARIAIFAAGPAFNFVLAVVFFWMTFVIGVPGMKAVIGTPLPGSIAATAGLHDGDRVTAANGEPVASWSELRTALLKDVLGSRELRLTVQSGPRPMPGETARTVTLDLTKARLDPQYLFDDIGLEPYQPKLAPVIGEVMADSAAQQAGLKGGDRILRFNDEPVESFQQLQKLVAARPGEVVRIEYRRGDATATLPVLLATAKDGSRSFGRLGATAARMADDDDLWHDLRIIERLDPLTAVPRAVQQTGHETVMVLQVLYRMVRGEISPRNLSGPISTAQAAGFAASQGVSTFLFLVAFVSLNVGIVNLLPIPVLDGGQIVNLVIEAVKGSPLSERAQAVVQQLGFTLLILIMGFAFINDIARQIG